MSILETFWAKKSPGLASKFITNLILYLDFLECTMAKSSRFIEVEKIQMSDAEIIGDCHRKNTRTTNDGSAYPECNNKTGDNKTGEWKSLKHNRQMMNRRAYEIRKLQRKVGDQCLTGGSENPLGSEGVLKCPITSPSYTYCGKKD